MLLKDSGADPSSDWAKGGLHPLASLSVQFQPPLDKGG